MPRLGESLLTLRVNAERIRRARRCCSRSNIPFSAPAAPGLCPPVISIDGAPSVLEIMLASYVPTLSAPLGTVQVYLSVWMYCVWGERPDSLIYCSRAGRGSLCSGKLGEPPQLVGMLLLSSHADLGCRRAAVCSPARLEMLRTCQLVLALIRCRALALRDSRGMVASWAGCWDENRREDQRRPWRLDGWMAGRLVGSSSWNALDGRQNKASQASQHSVTHICSRRWLSKRMVQCTGVPRARV